MKASVFSNIKFLIYVLGFHVQRATYDLKSDLLTPALWTGYKDSYFLASFIKNFPLYDFSSLVDGSILDFIGKKYRFVSFFSFLSVAYNSRLLLLSQVREGYYLISLTSLFDSAGWIEREAWDMFGCYFAGNRFMARLLTDYGFKGFPLRKDFPLSGFWEIVYDDYEKKIIQVLVELMQEYRTFSFKSDAWSTNKN